MKEELEKPASNQDGSASSPQKAPEKEKEGSIKDYIRIFHYCDKYDWTLNAIAFACAIASGSSLPLMTIIFGSFTNKFNTYGAGGSNTNQFRDDVDSFVLWFIYLFIGKFVVTYIATAAISVSAIRTTRKLRDSFL